MRWVSGSRDPGDYISKLAINGNLLTFGVFVAKYQREALTCYKMTMGCILIPYVMGGVWYHKRAKGFRGRWILWKNLNRKSSFIHWYFLRKWKDSMAGLSKLDIYWWYFHTFRDCSELGLHLHGRILSSTLSILEDLQIFTKIFGYWKRRVKIKPWLIWKTWIKLRANPELLTLSSKMYFDNLTTQSSLNILSVNRKVLVWIQYHLLTFQILKFWNNQSALRHYQWQ